METFINEIKKKKELRDIDNDFILDMFGRYNISNLTPKEKKVLIKDTRAKLRLIYGLFRTKQKGPILERHASTRERLLYYKELYHHIFEITGKPKVILDLGCGVNPFSYRYLGIKPVYYAYDISHSEINAINGYFSRSDIKGKAEILNLMHVDEVKKLPKADVAFIFKMTEMFDLGKGHKKPEEVLLQIPSKWLVVSFATRTMSGKRMTAPRRRWMEWLCTRLGWGYELIEFPNEIFYVIGK